MMSWFTKTVVVEKVVDRPVLGDASKATIYEAYTTETKRVGDCFSSHSYQKEIHLGYYISCAEAFNAHPGVKVKERSGIRIGAEYFVVSGLTPVTVTKPKRGKGKA